MFNRLQQARLVRLRRPTLSEHLARTPLRDSENRSDHSVHCRRREALRSFAAPPPSGSGCPESDRPPSPQTRVLGLQPLEPAAPDRSSDPRTRPASGRRSAPLSPDWPPQPRCLPDLATSACRSLLITCSGVCLLHHPLSRLLRHSHSHSSWIGSRVTGHHGRFRNQGNPRCAGGPCGLCPREKHCLNESGTACRLTGSLRSSTTVPTCRYSFSSMERRGGAAAS